ncbi:MAG: TRAP transporter substrate-binding protein DctP [Hyphomonadaceae bacterium JAD_PAG50586_4]|nr:MAG: TRAP transporter substrate-binding protein DctP [Hyphomonadaceae bacterium JAD_PAG50586_4]
MAISRRSVLAAAAVLGGCETPPRAEILAALAGAKNAELNGIWIWLSTFAATLQAGGMSVEVSANSALGGRSERTELSALGLLHVNDANIQEVSAFSSTYVALELPFLIDSFDHFQRFVDAPDFRSAVNRELSRSGMVFADAALLGGASGLFTVGRAVRTPDDLRGMRLRGSDARSLVLIEAFGASSVQVAWEEVPQALQTGIASGYLNPPIAALLFGHGSQLDYFVDLRTSIAHRAIVMSRRWLDRLNADQLALVERGTQAARIANRAWAEERRRRELSALTEVGIEVISLSAEARRAFVARGLGSYQRMAASDVILGAVAAAQRTRQ